MCRAPFRAAASSHFATGWHHRSAASRSDRDRDSIPQVLAALGIHHLGSRCATSTRPSQRYRAAPRRRGRPRGRRRGPGRARRRAARRRGPAGRAAGPLADDTPVGRFLAEARRGHAPRGLPCRRPGRLARPAGRRRRGADRRAAPRRACSDCRSHSSIPRAPSGCSSSSLNLEAKGMADGSLVRFEIGFTGGGATSGQADAAGLKALEDALTSPSGAPLVTLESEGTRLWCARARSPGCACTARASASGSRRRGGTSGSEGAGRAGRSRLRLA